ncbi:MAG: acyl-CoA thioester hydrolase/BAAT C-terminal domain-containing protein [Candidatus Acidiferrales bacterium]
MTERTMQIEITPNPALVDELVRIRVRGAAAGERVRLAAWTMDDAARRWDSRAEFVARGDGSVDLAEDASRAGTYRGVDAMGLFWSLALNPGDAGQHDQYLKRELTPCEITFEASSPGVRSIARARLERQYVPPGTIVRAVEEDRLAGLLFLPPRSANEDDAHRFPAVITLGGSGGGLDWEMAAALSAHGYAGFALPYFGFDPLPSSLNSIPLEYFERAIAWLCRQPEIDAGRLAVHGISRGGELALLLATKIPLLRAVVGVVPGNVVWQGTGAPPADSSGSSAPDGGEGTPAARRGEGAAVGKAAGTQPRNGLRSSWTYRGAPLPFVPYALKRFRLWTAVRVITMRKPVRFARLHRDSLKQRDAVERAAIPVEEIRAPILLVSSEDDQVWPSEEMSGAIEERLAACRFGYEFKHLRNPGAGHMLRLPHTPATTLASKLPNFGLRIAFGGTPAATARARVSAWRETLEFLRRNL